MICHLCSVPIVAFTDNFSGQGRTVSPMYVCVYVCVCECENEFMHIK